MLDVIVLVIAETSGHPSLKKSSTLFPVFISFEPSFVRQWLHEAGVSLFDDWLYDATLAVVVDVCHWESWN